jgi:hypothetical protein
MVGGSNAWSIIRSAVDRLRAIAAMLLGPPTKRPPASAEESEPPRSRVLRLEPRRLPPMRES